MAFTVPISLMCCFVICLRIKTVQANCYNTGNFTANGTYSKNRETIIASLASNAAANGGFYKFSVGNGSDTVYATALCRGDASPTQCLSCEIAAMGSSKEARRWSRVDPKTLQSGKPAPMGNPAAKRRGDWERKRSRIQLRLGKIRRRINPIGHGYSSCRFELRVDGDRLCESGLNRLFFGPHRPYF
ncbi:hypothetical protein ACFE04_001543 [Oxalis oulophora]